MDTSISLDAYILLFIKLMFIFYLFNCVIEYPFTYQKRKGKRKSTYFNWTLFSSKKKKRLDYPTFVINKIIGKTETNVFYLQPIVELQDF